MGESRNGAHSPNSSLTNPKTETWRRTVERELEKEGLTTCSAAASAAEDRTA